VEPGGGQGVLLAAEALQPANLRSSPERLVAIGHVRAYAVCISTHAHYHLTYLSSSANKKGDSCKLHRGVFLGWQGTGG
jgi:hypothetical protein